MQVEGGRLEHECLKEDMKVHDLHAEWAVFRDI